MSRWFRYYEEALNDPKIIRLSDSMFRAWVNLLTLASIRGGAIPKEDIAIGLRVSEKGAASVVSYLVERGLFEDRGDFVSPHNWEVRQYKSDKSTDRVKRFRNAKRNVSETETETQPVTPPEQSRAETEQRIDSADALHAEFLRVAKSDLDDPTLFGSSYGIQAMLSRGFSRETILAGAANAMRGKEKPPPWNYFAKCIESENEQRSQPAKPEIARGKPETLTQTAARLAESGISFGPRPSLEGSGDAVRMLPEGRCE